MRSGGVALLPILKFWVAVFFLLTITFCVSAARPPVPVANRTQEQLEPPVKTSAGQPRVGRRRSRRKPNKPTPNQRTGRDRSKRWLLGLAFSLPKRQKGDIQTSLLIKSLFDTTCRKLPRFRVACFSPQKARQCLKYKLD